MDTYAEFCFVTDQLVLNCGNYINSINMGVSCNITSCFLCMYNAHINFLLYFFVLFNAPVTV